MPGNTLSRISPELFASRCPISETLWSKTLQNSERNACQFSWAGEEWLYHLFFALSSSIFRSSAFSGRRHFLMNFFFKSLSSGFRFPSPWFPPTFFLPGMSAGGSSAKPRYRRFFAPPRALFSAAFAAASPERLAIIPSPLPFVNTFLSFCF